MYGHGLGACLAVLYGLHLENENYHIAKILTFGQPRMVRKKEINVFASLPLLRIVDFFDPLPVQVIIY